MTQPQLAPVSPEVKARRKRQNRVIVAVVVLVLVPVLSVTLSNKYVDYVMAEWTSHPTFALNTSFTVDLDPGDYVVWTFGDTASCTVSLDGTPLATTDPGPQVALASQGIYPSIGFTTRVAGSYLVTCDADSSSGYAMVSTGSPIGKATIVRLIGYGLAGAGGILGLVLLIIALVTNSSEKKQRLYLPNQMIYRR